MTPSQGSAEAWLLPECAPEPPPDRPALMADEDLPPGPYSVGLTYDGPTERRTPPFTLLCGDGRCIVGHIESRRVADRLAALLNATETGEKA